MSAIGQACRKRSNGFEDTHRDLIAAAVHLIAEKGEEGLSVSALARVSGFNRTTIYEHFSSLDVLTLEVRAWCAEQLSRAFRPIASQTARIDYVIGFVLENAELIKIWMRDLLSPGDMRDSYPQWEVLVEDIAADFASRGEDVDAEVFCLILITSAIVGPQVLQKRVSPSDSVQHAKQRFRSELRRMLRGYGLSRP